MILSIVDFQLDAQEAVDAGRMDHEWMPDILRIEERGISKRALKILRAMGHNVRTTARLGDAHSIMVDPVRGVFIGAADKRSNGSAVGY